MRARRIAGVVLWVVVAVTAAAPERVARADAATAVYGDVKDVIEELIRSEIAQNVVAAVRARSPGIAVYFDDTLDRLASPYWGNLVTALQKDLIELVGDFVYVSVLEGSAEGALPTFLECVGGGKGPACTAMRETLARGKTLLDDRCRADGTDAQAAAVDAGVRARNRVACDV